MNDEFTGFTQVLYVLYLKNIWLFHDFNGLNRYNGWFIAALFTALLLPAGKGFACSSECGIGFYVRRKQRRFNRCDSNSFNNEIVAL